VYYFPLENAVFSPTCVGFSGLSICLLNLILYIIDVPVNNTSGMQLAGEGIGLFET